MKTRSKIRNVFVWDGQSGARSPQPMTIRIESDRIVDVAPESTVRSEGFDYALAFDAAGEEVTALPGLIDSHVHMTLDPTIGSPVEQLALTPEQVWQGMRERAEAMVRAGITTARDLGAGQWKEMELRDRIADGALPGPRLLCAGQPLTAPGGHCHFWGGEARGSEQVRAVIDRQVEHRADWIKVMATGGVFTKGTDVKAAQYDAAELREIVEHARTHARSVAAHCHGRLGIGNALAGGVRTIEHCSFAGSEGFGSDFDEALVPEIAAAEAWVSPTVNAVWGMRVEKDGQPTPFFERMSRCLGSLRAAGARFVASTDAGIPAVKHHHLPRALEVFARYAGLSPVETLRAATSEPARALGLVGETGRLAPGLAADIVLVKGNPLVDLAVLQSPLLVVARGRVFEVAPDVRGEGPFA